MTDEMIVAHAHIVAEYISLESIENELRAAEYGDAHSGVMDVIAVLTKARDILIG